MSVLSPLRYPPKGQNLGMDRAALGPPTGRTTSRTSPLKATCRPESPRCATARSQSRTDPSEASDLHGLVSSPDCGRHAAAGTAPAGLLSPGRLRSVTETTAPHPDGGTRMAERSP